MRPSLARSPPPPALTPRSAMLRRALGFDAGKLPKRTEPADDGVLVKLFDWGRSELLTAEAFEQLSARQQADRRRFWSYYCGGVSTLTWNAAREYFRRFGNAEDWDEVSLRMVDFDAMTKVRIQPDLHGSDCAQES